MSTEDILQHCQDQKIQLTEIRGQVLNILSHSKMALGAYEILEQLKKQRDNAKPMTIYRALNFLCQHHLAHKIEASNKYVLCCHPGAKNCLLFICQECGQKQERHNNMLYQQLNLTAEKALFSMHSTSLEVYGICEKCT